MPSSYTSETIRNNKPRNVLTPHAANEKVFKAGLRVPSTFRTVRSHTKQERMPEISPLADSTADLQPCKQIPSGIRSVLRPFFLLSSHTLFRHSILRCIRLQWLPHLQRPSHILHLAFSALLCPPRFSLNAPHLPSPATRPQAPFPRRTLLLLPGACKYLQTFPLLWGKPSPHKLLLPMLRHLALTTYRQDGHQLLVRRSSCLKPPPAFITQMSLLSLCSYCGQCK